MKALVVNCSAPHYNLGATKMAHWLRSEGHDVTELRGDPGLFTLGYDLIALSVIFSWDALKARDIAVRVKDASEVWCGGPGVFALRAWWKRQTGMEIVVGLDPRFDKFRGDFKMTFASRGCPVGCSFCIVPGLEGSTFSFDPEFSLAPVLCDNNLSALPIEYQDHIISRYRDSGTRLLDANSGFEPATFNDETYARWKPILRGPWRFALDEMRELEEVRQMMEILKDEGTRKKNVYVLVGNEPIDQCYERAIKVIEWGGYPYCQPEMKLNTLTKSPVVKYDWTAQLLSDFARYFNRYLWKYTHIADYNHRKNTPPPFAELIARV